ncbi:MAG: HNH endonuclease signature motif containing protein [Chloroflexota bacterium]
MTYIPEVLRQEVMARAKQCCEYCLLHERDSIYSHEIDHIIPEKHRGETVSDNLCYACLDCNRNKGSDFGSFDPETDEVALLFHPRKDIWSEHFKLEDGQIIPISAKGRVTEFVLKFNTTIRVRNRKLLSEAGRYPPREPSTS